MEAAGAASILQGYVHTYAYSIHSTAVTCDVLHCTYVHTLHVVSQKALRQLLSSADVICSTLTGASQDGPMK